MAQAVCYDIAGLSEIEKYLLLLVMSSPGIRLPALFARYHYPTRFLHRVIDLLAGKDLITVDPVTSVVLPVDVVDIYEVDGFKPFTKFSSNDMLHISCPAAHYDRMMKVLDYLYQNSLDLFILNYNMEAIKNIREILSILKNDVVSDFHMLLIDLDAEFFSIFDLNQRYFNDDNAGFFIDFSLNIIYKIIHNVREIVECGGESSPPPSKYRGFYDGQASSIEALGLYLEGLRSTTRQGAWQDAPGSGIISAYFILFFHKKIGPLMYYESENDLGDDIKAQITKLMDVVNSEPFLFTVQSTTTWNYQFELESPLARGHKEYLQLTLVLPAQNASRINEIVPIVARIIEKTRQEREMYRIFYLDETNSGFGPIDDKDLATRLKGVFLDNFSVLNRYIRPQNGQC